MASSAVVTTFNPTRAWWKSACIYQIYPISFFDSNGDGIGDLPGILAKLDYLKDLGVDVLWLCPIYKSPLADMGYDIADYESIDPRFGTLEDWDRLLEGVHKRGMKLLMDLVVNHTSDQHAWFKDPKRDWYIWRSPRYDADGNRMPPNNWESIFSGPAWEWDEETGEYYLHLFVKEQPDLNWENPDVRAAVFKTMRFWLDRGCDGFRMDVINMISKVPGLPDAPVLDSTKEFQGASLYYANGPRVHEFLKEMNEKVLSRYDVMTVGETPCTHLPEDIAAYVFPQNKELNMVFQFELMDLDLGGAEDNLESLTALMHRQWKLTDMKKCVSKWQTYMREHGYWNTLYIENHDQARSVSRFGNDTPRWRALSAKVLAMLQTTQTGTLYVYQGEEIGMKNFPRSWSLEEYKDVATINYYKQERTRRQKETGKENPNMEDIIDGFQRKARDHARTPLQWNAASHAGFSTGTPWMRVNDDYAEGWNVEAEMKDPGSVWHFWKRALKLRRQHEVFVYGDFVLLLPDHEQVFAFERTLRGEKALVVLNFSERDVSVDLGTSAGVAPKMRVALSNYDDVLSQPLGGTAVTLRGYEGRVYV
ncbi:glycoside hydrolase family 13 protein [Phanerochaete carnosa HHB-10118-sp]|uniref:Glycoside hydrolase family 13 protein n=1 Tax=Phanerochaete carnosa (strain HHB-10118-sp) TaxID=650164 RepID=K5VXU0_PHACS|nr:glycoside hydrolase family 13 protein [Phanerochaete carnosa HHB-10118-sp]EKM51645.1 glycoside hydrolase family 13 protein [Phanerochaete carnosa HHB-10118-sp]